MVPDTINFDIFDVINELGTGADDLIECFDDANPYFFHPVHKGDKTNLLNFRAYGQTYFHIESMGIEEQGVDNMVMYRGLCTDVFKPGGYDKKLRTFIVNNIYPDQIRNMTISLYNEGGGSVADTMGAMNCKFVDTNGEIPDYLIWGTLDGGHWVYINNYRYVCTVVEPGTYWLALVHDDDLTSKLPAMSYGIHYREVTLKRYVDIDPYNILIEKASATPTFQVWLTEGVEVLSNTSGLTIVSPTSPTYMSPTTVHLSITATTSERVLTCTCRTLATVLREEKVFTVYQRGDAWDYLSCTEISPGITMGSVGGYANTHTFITKNNSTLMSYEGRIYWQIKQGDTEGSATYQAGGSRDLPEINAGDSHPENFNWTCYTSDGMNAYFYAMYESTGTWVLIDTHMIMT